MSRTDESGERATTARPGVLGPGIVLGVGLGGFVDGILLHQVLQWHHMLTSTGDGWLGMDPYPADTVAGLEVNTLWDGLFHVVAWTAVVVGLVWLWRRVAASGATWPRSALAGPLLAGWGLFNLVEGVVDHHLLGIHHVRAGPGQLWYDLAFLAVGAVLLVGGLAWHRRATRTPATSDAPTGKAASAG